MLFILVALLNLVNSASSNSLPSFNIQFTELNISKSNTDVGHYKLAPALVTVNPEFLEFSTGRHKTQLHYHSLVPQHSGFVLHSFTQYVLDLPEKIDVTETARKLQTLLTEYDQKLCAFIICYAETSLNYIPDIVEKKETTSTRRDYAICMYNRNEFAPFSHALHSSYSNFLINAPAKLINYPFHLRPIPIILETNAGLNPYSMVLMDQGAVFLHNSNSSTSGAFLYKRVHGCETNITIKNMTNEEIVSNNQLKLYLEEKEKKKIFSSRFPISMGQEFRCCLEADIYWNYENSLNHSHVCGFGHSLEFCVYSAKLLEKKIHEQCEIPRDFAKFKIHSVSKMSSSFLEQDYQFLLSTIPILGYNSQRFVKKREIVSLNISKPSFQNNSPYLNLRSLFPNIDGIDNQSIIEKTRLIGGDGNSDGLQNIEKPKFVGEPIFSTSNEILNKNSFDTSSLPPEARNILGFSDSKSMKFSRFSGALDDLLNQTKNISSNKFKTFFFQAEEIFTYFHPPCLNEVSRSEINVIHGKIENAPCVNEILAKYLFADDADNSESKLLEKVVKMKEMAGDCDELKNLSEEELVSLARGKRSEKGTSDKPIIIVPDKNAPIDKNLEKAKNLSPETKENERIDSKRRFKLTKKLSTNSKDGDENAKNEFLNEMADTGEIVTKDIDVGGKTMVVKEVIPDSEEEMEKKLKQYFPKEQDVMSLNQLMNDRLFWQYLPNLHAYYMNNNGSLPEAETIKNSLEIIKDKKGKYNMDIRYVINDTMLNEKDPRGQDDKAEVDKLAEESKKLSKKDPKKEAKDLADYFTKPYTPRDLKKSIDRKNAGKEKKGKGGAKGGKTNPDGSATKEALGLTETLQSTPQYTFAGDPKNEKSGLPTLKGKHSKSPITLFKRSDTMTVRYDSPKEYKLYPFAYKQNISAPFKELKRDALAQYFHIEPENLISTSEEACKNKDPKFGPNYNVTVNPWERFVLSPFNRKTKRKNSSFITYIGQIQLPKTCPLKKAMAKQRFLRRFRFRNSQSVPPIQFVKEKQEAPEASQEKSLLVKINSDFSCELELRKFYLEKNRVPSKHKAKRNSK